jgi:hypothetical protein
VGQAADYLCVAGRAVDYFLACNGRWSIHYDEYYIQWKNGFTMMFLLVLSYYGWDAYTEMSISIPECRSMKLFIVCMAT